MLELVLGTPNAGAGRFSFPRRFFRVDTATAIGYNGVKRLEAELRWSNPEALPLETKLDADGQWPLCDYDSMSHGINNYWGWGCCVFFSCHGLAAAPKTRTTPNRGSRGLTTMTTHDYHFHEIKTSPL